MSAYFLFLAFVTLITVAIISANNGKQPKPVPRIVQEPPVVIAQPEPVLVPEIPVKKEENEFDLTSVYNQPAENEDVDVPSVAFPKLDDDPESEMASALSYQNLQDSFLSSRSGMRSRNAWSRLGARNNELLWNTQMEALKKQIEESGLTYEQFVEQSLTPIPEQFADFWKSQHEVTGEIKRQEEKLPDQKVLNEASSIVSDATQPISKTDERLAKHSMQSILDARKRAKKLGLKIPDITNDQKNSLNKWSENSSTEGLVKAVESTDENNVKKTT